MEVLVGDMDRVEREKEIDPASYSKRKETTPQVTFSSVNNLKV
jgi:hypothetical protein